MGSEKPTASDRLAVLIDADNAQASVIEEILKEVSRYGTASVKRAYGDWTTTNLKGWKEILHRLAILPMQQFSYTAGKNATDSALIIDAMDLLHAGHLDGVCLVSSDSDFTRLATRLREAGLVVYGFGERKTPEAFVAACDKFVYTEVLKSPLPVDSPSQPAAIRKKATPASLKALESMIRVAVNATAKDDGWALLSAVGGILLKNSPSFDARNYDYPKLGELVRNQAYLESKDVPVAGSASTNLYVRLRPTRTGEATRDGSGDG